MTNTNAKTSPRFRLRPLVMALRQAGVIVFASSALASAQVPTGGTVVQGTATITNLGAGRQRITEGSDRAVINWQSFSIGASNSVQFVQPSASSVVLNRVVTSNPSSIFGSLSANGQVFLVNPNGVYFGPNASIDVTGLLATTLNIRDGDFMAGRYVFSRDPSSPASAAVINDGAIRARPGGYVVLAGDYVANGGVIEAKLGTVALAAAGRFTLDFGGDNLINFAVNDQTLSQLAGVANSGQVLADGGRVVMTASVARDLTGTVVNNSGLIQARGTSERDGAIYLTGDNGDVASSGRLDASGARGGQVTVSAQNGTAHLSGDIDAGGDAGSGGSVQVLGKQVGLFGAATIDASGATAGGVVLVGGDYQGKNPAVQNAERTYVGPDARIEADALESGGGGKIIVWSDDVTRYYGSISARGGARSGNGGLAEVSGHRLLDFNGAADLSAAHGAGGTLLLDPLNITISNTAAANTTGFVPPGDQTEAFADDAASTSNFDVTAGTGSFANVANGTTIRLQASNNITVNNAFDLGTATGKTNVSLALQANNDIVLNAGITAAGTGTLSLAADADGSGTGAISGAGALTQTAGTLALSAGSGINVQTSAPAVSFANTSGAVSINNTSAAGVTVSGTNSGAVGITETTGALAVGASGITTGGNTVTLNSAGTITQSGTLSGTTLTTSSVGGTTLNGANAVTHFNATNTGSGNIALTDTAAPLTITGISQAGGGGATISNTGAIDVTGAISTAANGAISLTAANGSVTVGNTVTAGGSGNITLASTGANDIAVNADVGTTTGSIFLNSGGAITGGGTVTAGGLAMKTGSGSIGSSGTPLQISSSNFAAQSAGGVFVAKAAGALTLGNVALGGLNGITAAAGNDIAVQATGITVAQNVTASGSGTVALSAGTGTLATNAGANISAPAGVTLVADDFALDPASITKAAGGVVTLLQSTNGRGFSLGAGTTAGTAGLSQAEVQTVSASTLRIGNNQTGAIAVDGNLTLLANEGALSLATGNAAITQTAGTSLVTPGGLAAQTGSGGVTLDQTGNSLKTVAINTTGNVSLGSIDAFTIAKVDGIAGIVGNNVTLATGQTTTGGITTGTATLTVASATGLAPNDRVVVAGADAGGTDLITSVVSVAGNTVTLAANAGTTVAGAKVTRLATTGTVAAGSNSLAVASGNGFSVNDRIIVPGAGLNGADLTTTITAIGGSGTTLTLAVPAATGVTNAFIVKPSFIGGPATVTTGGSINSGATTLSVASTAGFAVGDPIGVAGAGSSGDLATTIDGISGNTITLHNATGTTVSAANVYHTDQGIDAAGTVALNSALPGGFVQTGGSVIANNLLLQGYGPYSLNGAGLSNHVNTLAADVTGNVSFVNNAALTIGSVGGVDGVTTRAMLVSPAMASPSSPATYTSVNISISTNSAQSLATDAVALQIDQPITAGIKDPAPAGADPTPVTARTGQLLLFLVGDTKAVGSGQLEASLLNLSANVGQGTFGDASGLTSKVGSLLLTGSKSANIDNSAYTGALTVFSLGQRDVAITGTASSGATTTVGGQQVSTLTDNSQTFVVGAQAGRQIQITGGTGAGQVATVLNNDAHTLTITSNWTTIPDSTSTYQIGQNQDSRAGNVTLKTGGAMQVASINNTGDLSLTSAGNQTITLLTSTGQNLLFRADALNISAALTTPGVNVILQPFTPSNVVGINNATGAELPHTTTTGDITTGTQTLTVASATGLNQGDAITIAGAGPGGANLVTSITTVSGTTITINDAADTTVAGATVTDAAVGAGGTNYSAALLGKFNAKANIVVGGDSLTAPVGITGSPVLSGNVFIGNDGAVNLGTQNLSVSTTGNIVAHDIGTVNNLSLVAGGAGGITLDAFNSTGTNLLFKADALSLPGTASSYTSAAGVNVTLSPYTLSSTVGVHDAIDYGTYTPGSIAAGSNVLAVNSTAGFAVGNTVVVTGAGAGGNAPLTTTILALGEQVTLGANAGTAVTSAAVTITPLIGAPIGTTGTVQAGTNDLILPAGTTVNAGDNIKITGAGAAGVDLLTTVSTVGAPESMLLNAAATTTANTVEVGLQSTQLPTITPNYPVALLAKFNGTANITVGGTDVAHPLTGDVHIGSDVTPAEPFDIGTRTLTIATSGGIINHLAPAVNFPTSSSGSVPPGYAWTPGQTPTTGTGSTGGGGSGGSGGSGGGGGSGGSGGSGGGGAGTAGPSGGPTSGSTGAATDTGGSGSPGSGGTSSGGGSGDTSGDTGSSGGGTTNPTPTASTDPGGSGTVVIAYTGDGSTDSGTTDTGTTDTDGTTTGSTDTGDTTTGSTDTGDTTTGSTDTGDTTTGSTDTGDTTTGSTDTGDTTIGSTDSGSTTAGSTDTGDTTIGSTDTGSTTSGSTDTGSTTTGSADTGDTTTGSTDTGGTTTASTDTGGTTSGSTDTGSTTTGSTDTGDTTTASTDTGGSTTGSTDSGSTTVGSSDTGTAATGSTDTGGTTTGSTDTGGTTTASTDTGGATTGSTDAGGTNIGSTDAGSAPEDSGAANGGTTVASSDAGSSNSGNSASGSNGTGETSTGSNGSGAGTASTESGTAGAGTGEAGGTAGGGGDSGGSTTTTSAGSTTGTGSTGDNGGSNTGTTTSGTTTASSGSSDAGSNGPSTQPSADCPSGTAASAPDAENTPCAGGATGSIPSSAAVTITAQSANAVPATALAADQGNESAPGSAIPNTGGAPSRVFAVQGDGVNLYRAGRRNGPGTPDPNLRR